MIVHLLSLQYPRHIRYAQDPKKSLGQPRSIVRCPGCCKASSSVPLTLVTTHQSNTLLSAPPREPLTPHLGLYLTAVYLCLTPVKTDLNHIWPRRNENWARDADGIEGQTALTQPPGHVRAIPLTHHCCQNAWWDWTVCLWYWRDTPRTSPSLPPSPRPPECRGWAGRTLRCRGSSGRAERR